MYFDDDDYSVKGTDDFYTYNSRDFDERVNQDVLTLPANGEIETDYITEWD